MLPVEELAKQLASRGNTPKILEMEAWMDQQGGRQNAKEVLQYEHLFLPGVYVRVMKLPKNHFLTGRIHKQDEISILAQGRMRVIYPEGQKDIEAPYVGKFPAGVKKLGYALEDCTFINVFNTSCTDIDKVEDELGCTDFMQYAQFLLEDKK